MEMNKKKNITIVVLIIALGVAIYFAFQNTQSAQQEKSVTNIILSNQELRVAYEKSLRYSSIADIAELSCFPISRFDCGGEGCMPTAPAAYFFVDYGTEGGTYFRCDIKGCDSYPIKVNPSGEFTQFTPSQGQAMLFKVATGDVLGNRGEFIDIATLGTGAIISTGKCEFAK